jgi:hypothetical protein
MELWVPRMEVASCYPCGAKNLDMPLRFIKSFAPLLGVIKEHEILVQNSPYITCGDLQSVSLHFK